MADVDRSRRSFLSRALAVLGGLAALEAVWISTTFLGPRQTPKGSEQNNGLFIAGPIERFEPGTVTAFREGKFYLVHLEGGGLLALHRKCTHLGCTVPWLPDEQKFACPCHASAFDIRGDVLSAPAPRALDRFAVHIENGIVKVDTSKAIRRSAFAWEQVTRV